MKLFKTGSISLLAMLLSVAAIAQDRASLIDYITRLPQPPATLQQAMEKRTTDTEILLAASSRSISTDEAYRPLYAHFLKNLEGGAANSTAYSAVERTLYRNYSISAKGLSSTNQYLQFQLLIEDRPLLSSGLLSWGLPGKFPGAEKDWYLQVLSVEKMLGNSLPKSNALVAKLDFGGSDPALNAINETFNKTFAALPKRSVKTAEGFTLEVEDPDKAIAAYKIYGQNRQDHFAQAYRTQFLTWQLQHQRLQAIAEKLEALSAQASAKTPVGAVLLSDLQGRLWNAATHLFSATDRLWQDVLLAQLGQDQVREAIEIYTGYKANLQ